MSSIVDKYCAYQPTFSSPLYSLSMTSLASASISEINDAMLTLYIRVTLQCR